VPAGEYLRVLWTSFLMVSVNGRFSHTITGMCFVVKNELFMFLPNSIVDVLGYAGASNYASYYRTLKKYSITHKVHTA